MFIDASAIVACLTREAEAERCAAAMQGATARITSPIAVWEAAVALARPDKLDVPVETAGKIVLEFIEERGIELRDLPPAEHAVRLSLSAAQLYRSGVKRLNFGDCFHYAAAKFFEMPILSTHEEFRFTDVKVVE